MAGVCLTSSQIHLKAKTLRQNILTSYGETQFINSIEREDITDSFNDMAAAVGVTDIDGVIEDCRDW